MVDSRKHEGRRQAEGNRPARLADFSLRIIVINESPALDASLMTSAFS